MEWQTRREYVYISSYVLPKMIDRILDRGGNTHHADTQDTHNWTLDRGKLAAAACS